MARLTDLITEIVGLVGGIKAANGYSHDWGTVNEVDDAMPKTYPSAVVRYKLENADEGVQALYGFANAEVSIEVEAKLEETENNPILALDEYFDKALGDLRKLFYGSNGYLPLTGEAVITYKSAERIDAEMGDLYRPAKMLTKWNLFYHY